MNGINHFPNITTSAMRRIVVTLIVFGVFVTGSSVYAAVPTYVVEFEINTKFERSLEKFMFDLFNTLQKRDEDFTAAFELQKIEKAREDVNKLFQETQAELINYGLAYEAYDERLIFADNQDDAPLLISPLKGNRIIQDPAEYLVGEPIQYGRMAAACRMNYFIWDQQGLIEIYGDTTNLPGNVDEILTEIEAGVERSTYGEDTQASVDNLVKTKRLMLSQLHYGHWPTYSTSGSGSGGATNLVDDDPSLNPVFFGYADIENVLPACNSIMEILHLESPESALEDVIRGTVGAPFNPWEQARMVRDNLGFPSLPRNLVDQKDVSFEEMDALYTGPNSNVITGLTSIVAGETNAVIGGLSSLHKLNYQIGQGLRPENLYVAVKDTDSIGYTNQALYLNTELIVSPAIVLLQKMQAATQATFDLAGQGFLYLDPVETPAEILGRYNLASTSSNEEARKICNNAGACQLLDAWLKPAAAFRSIATIDGTQYTPKIIGAPADDSAEEYIPGSGLPAPWEDESPYNFFTPENSLSLATNRYTVSRFRLTTGGLDENDDSELNDTQPDNIGQKYAGADFPINDWYDRVFEMYEAGIGKNSSGREGSALRSGFYGLDDWECSIALWFREKQPGQLSLGGAIGGYQEGSISYLRISENGSDFDLDHCGLTFSSEELTQFRDPIRP